ncbi:hypothetical protein K435DRAFT_424419 [Dendrothele bispora CBS 962.96]|uniref:Uncharacterized protein n=1 Tax=Dendrothele bispora (strain CBS 962.96) TaxID=1314807 RepID=A0A4S8L4Y9_DENBC|nr:hypothetical protein K435DRAFT_52787 [Dendrothele bispora CBS 962.96]THU83654.1 hypothetical protein K435DRAFT_424419 [Dendrothele bispora CBS 962.96]
MLTPFPKLESTSSPLLWPTPLAHMSDGIRSPEHTVLFPLLICIFLRIISSTVHVSPLSYVYPFINFVYPFAILLKKCDPSCYLKPNL